MLKSTTKIFLPQLVRTLFCGHTGCKSGLDRQAKSTPTVESSSFIMDMLHLCNVKIFRPKCISRKNCPQSTHLCPSSHQGLSWTWSSSQQKARYSGSVVSPPRPPGSARWTTPRPPFSSTFVFALSPSSHHTCSMEIGSCWNSISNFVVCTCFLLRADIVSDLCRFLIVALLTTGKRS